MSNFATVTGTLQNPDGSAITSNCFVRFWLRGCNGNQPKVGGVALIGPDNGTQFWLDASPNGSGLVTASLFGNDVVSAGGQTGVTWWGATVYTNGIPGPETSFTFNSSTSYDLATATPITVAPVVAAPTGDTTYARLDGGNQPFTATIKPNADNTINLGDSTHRWGAFLGTSTTKTLNNIRVASEFVGADWAAKVTAADADLGSTPGEIWVNQAAGQTAAAAAPTLSTYHVLRFVQPGNYPIAVGWTITSLHDFAIIGVPGTVISFTGSAGFTIDGSALGNGSRRVLLRDLIFSGNASVANACTLNKVCESTFENITGMNCTGAAILCQGVLESTFIRPASSLNNNLGPVTYSTIPAVGLQLDTNGSVSTNSNHFTSPTFEGLTGGIGISIVNGSSNTFTGGTSEANATGISITATNGADNTFTGIDLESNTTADITCAGPRNNFFGCRAFSSSSALFQLNSGATNCVISGGRYYAITLASGATDNRFYGVSCQNFTINAGANGTGVFGMDYSVNGAGGAFTNSATNTAAVNVRNLFSGAWDSSIFTNLTSDVLISTAGQLKGASVLDLFTNGSNRWEIGGTGHFYTFGDNTQDIGAAPSNLPRTITAKTSMVVQGLNGETWKRGYNTELLTLSTSGTTTDTVGSLLPANSIIEAVVARVTTTITTATDWKLGDATIAGRFTAADSVMTAGETQVGTVMADQTGTSGPRQVSAAKVRVTTTGTPGAGAIRITVFFRQYVAPTA